MPVWLDWLKDGGVITLLIAMGAFLRKVMQRLDRDEYLRADYPPHRHVITHSDKCGCKLIYPHEYTPSRID